MPDVRNQQNENNIIEEAKIKKLAKFNLDLNICYYYQKDSSLGDYYQVYYKNGTSPQVKNGIVDLSDYMKKLKEIRTPHPCIKKFNEKDIKMNEKYMLAENLKEKEIIPDLCDEDDEDIKSLGQSLERSIDKGFGHSFNDKYLLNESNVSENIDDYSNSNNTGKNLIQKLQNMRMENINEDNEEEEKEEEEYSNEVEEENIMGKDNRSNDDDNNNDE